MLRARLDSPDENIRQSREQIFIVLSVLDLNREPRTVVSDPDYCLGIEQDFKKKSISPVCGYTGSLLATV